MGMKFKKGDAVTQIVAPIQGRIIGMIIVDDAPEYVVQWQDGEDVHERQFKEEQLSATPDAEPSDGGKTTTVGAAAA